MPRKENDINGLFNKKNIENIITVVGFFASLATIASFVLPKPQPTINYHYYNCNKPTSTYEFNRIIIA